MRFKKWTAASLATVLALAAGSALATPVMIAVTEGDASGVYFGTPVDAKSTFVGTLGNYTTETFETLTRGPNSVKPAIPLSILGGAGSIVFNTSVALTSITNSTAAGRFNTTQPPNPIAAPVGQWLASPYSFTINLTTAVNAFGMYMTDLSDFKGTLKLEFCNGTVCSTPQFDFLAQNTVTGTNASGALSFLGYADATTSFNKINVNITQLTIDSTGNPILAGSYDVVGFDDLMVGNLATNQTPEPTSLALTGLALALAGHLARRRRA